VVRSAQQLREDEPKSNQTIINTILKNAPKSEEGFFVVPKIIE
jgi:aspartyl-tRNA(Asn)/glutamyl-tRNA(Gln) amidotransferase subunit C